ncbi:MAG: Threonine aldolase [Bacteroidetes bacterium]|jgi:threonine aldolase|nr:Threonine aldolase [Bacteroidota bacterium]
MAIDLRSDTVTKPSKEMLQAMFDAEVGDDVFVEDPTVLKLEEKAATMFGMENALFCPSGTMTNQIAIKVHTRQGDELLCDTNSHIYNYEGGGISFNSGVQAKILQGNRGKITAEQIAQNINGDYDWLCRTSLVSLENTVNKAGGSMYRLDEVKPVSHLCREKKLALHLDGARIFNALVETNESAKDWGSQFDSISICLSKGLGTPMGSLLLGNKEFIKQARRVRKVFGGGMRQAGYIAAAGIYALDHNINRLKEDHRRAKELRDIVAASAYVESVLPVETNIVIFNLRAGTSAADFEKKLSAKNLRVSVFGPQTIRLVTHLDFTDDMLADVKKIIAGL